MPGCEKHFFSSISESVQDPVQQISRPEEGHPVYPEEQTKENQCEWQGQVRLFFA